MAPGSEQCALVFASAGTGKNPVPIAATNDAPCGFLEELFNLVGCGEDLTQLSKHERLGGHFSKKSRLQCCAGT